MSYSAIMDHQQVLDCLADVESRKPGAHHAYQALVAHDEALRAERDNALANLDNAVVEGLALKAECDAAIEKTLRDRTVTEMLAIEKCRCFLDRTERAEKERGALAEKVKALEDLVAHLDGCRYCAEDSEPCDEGKIARAALADDGGAKK